jgi:hypothetical protein
MRTYVQERSHRTVATMKDPAKLTLRLERELIEAAREHARKQGTSLSRLVERHFRELASAGEEQWVKDLHPDTRYFLGLAQGADIDEKDYRRHLEEKHR